MTRERLQDDKKSKVIKKKDETNSSNMKNISSEPENSSLLDLQKSLGNQAVQRYVLQQSGEGSFELDQETAEKIKKQKGSGQPLSGSINNQVGAAIGNDFSSVKVHTSPEADSLNRQLNARAFTTGKDIFFREGEYQPHSSSGQELIAHELTHVAQQASGLVGSTSGQMMVNAPDDEFERQADSVAEMVTGSNDVDNAHRQIAEGEEESVQMLAIHRQEEEEDEEIQTQEEDEEESLQTQEMEEEEELAV